MQFQGLIYRFAYVSAIAIKVSSWFFDQKRDCFSCRQNTNLHIRNRHKNYQNSQKITFHNPKSLFLFLLSQGLRHHFDKVYCPKKRNWRTSQIELCQFRLPVGHKIERGRTGNSRQPNLTQPDNSPMAVLEIPGCLESAVIMLLLCC